MSTSRSPRGRVIVVGAGPAGMATALSVHQAGHDVTLLERHPVAPPAGNVINLWPPPVKALGLLGVDIEDLGAACRTEFRSPEGRVRVHIDLNDETGAFLGLLRPELYERMQAALPAGTMRVNSKVASLQQNSDTVTVHLEDGQALEADLVVGADGIDSVIRQELWGTAPKREHGVNALSGFTFAEGMPAERGYCVLTHGSVVQGTWTAIRAHGRDGFGWWFVSRHEPGAEFDDDRRATALELSREFPGPLPDLIRATRPEDIQRWVIRDRKPISQWSTGRVTLVGDAAHATSPYAAYGAGMAIEDGYFLGRRLGGLDLTDSAALGAALNAFEAKRKPHTARQVQQAFVLGKVFHSAPRPLRAVRDTVLNRTPLLQKVVGDATPSEIAKQLGEIDAAEATFVAVDR